jgi:cell division protein FtsI (penicillin-binding protein 3)
VTRPLANRRIRLLVAAFALVFVLALGRAAWLQAIRAPGLDELASDQQRERVTLLSHRGTIYDRMGVELAFGEKATTVHANPKEIAAPAKVAPIIAEELGLDVRDVLAAISDRTRGFVYIQRKADPERAKALENRDIPGLGFSPEELRVYGQRKVAAPLLGFAGVDNDGLAGVELEYDRALAGQDGRETIVRDPFGRLLDVVDERPVKDGRDLYLTIDHRLQAHVEEVLRETRAEWAAKGATAIVLDPRTGQILALAQAPGYDANTFASVPAERVRLRAVTDPYEPGSTFKVVTVAAALEEELVGPSTTFYLDDEIHIADRVIRELDPREPEMLTVRDILERSSNVGVVTLALELERQRLVKWIDRFGFGRRLGVDFPGESPGIVLPRRRWTGSTIGTVPLGQGIAVTPLQMATAYAAIANGGVQVTPHLVARIGGDEVPAPHERRVISGSTAAQLISMMQGVVEEGTGLAAQVPDYTVAGKTGTAAKAEPTGGYSDTRYVASFVGIVPAGSPRLVILVAVDEPTGDIFGGVVAAPAFAQIAEFALQYLDIPPDAPDDDAG